MLIIIVPLGIARLLLLIQLHTDPTYICEMFIILGLDE
jgi:hypothetical protein